MPLFIPEGNKFSNVQDYENGARIWQKDLFSAKEFPTVGVLGPDLKVGAEAFGDANSINLKYALSLIGGLEPAEIEKYPPLKSLAQKLDIPGIRDELANLIASFFKMIRSRVDLHCRKKNLEYTRLAFTFPSQWGTYKTILETYESIIRKVWLTHQIIFITEIEGLAHALISEASNDLQPYDEVTFADFGGHTMVCLSILTS